MQLVTIRTTLHSSQHDHYLQNGPSLYEQLVEECKQWYNIGECFVIQFEYIDDEQDEIRASSTHEIQLALMRNPALLSLTLVLTDDDSSTTTNSSSSCGSGSGSSSCVHRKRMRNSSCEGSHRHSQHKDKSVKRMERKLEDHCKDRMKLKGDSFDVTNLRQLPDEIHTVYVQGSKSVLLKIKTFRKMLKKGASLEQAQSIFSMINTDLEQYTRCIRRSESNDNLCTIYSVFTGEDLSATEPESSTILGIASSKTPLELQSCLFVCPFGHEFKKLKRIGAHAIRPKSWLQLVHSTMTQQQNNNNFEENSTILVQEWIEQVYCSS